MLQAGNRKRNSGLVVGCGKCPVHAPGNDGDIKMMVQAEGQLLLFS
jgi:hypothetical protein